MVRMSRRAQELTKRAPSSCPPSLEEGEATAAAAVDKPPRRKTPRRRRTRSEDDSFQPPVENLRQVSIILVVGCLIFTWDLFYLMGYIEGVDGGISSASTDEGGPLRGSVWNTTTTTDLGDT